MPRTKKIDDSNNLQFLSDQVDGTPINYEALGDLAAPIQFPEEQVNEENAETLKKTRPRVKKGKVQEFGKNKEKPKADKNLKKKSDKKRNDKQESSEQQEWIPEVTEAEAPEKNYNPEISAVNEVAASETAQAETVANDAETSETAANAEGVQAKENVGEAPNNNQQQYQNNRNDFRNNHNNKKQDRYGRRNRSPEEQQQQPEEPLPPPDPEKIAEAMAKWKDLRSKPFFELQEKARELEIPDVRRLRKQALIYKILAATTGEDIPIYTEGVLEVVKDGFGFLRNPEHNYLAGPDDIYLNPYLVKRFDLKTGDTITGQVRKPRDNEKYFVLMRIDTVNGEEPIKSKRRVAFEYLTPVHPFEQLNLEFDKGEFSTRIMNLFMPIGKGQRSIILAPPRTGKTVLLKNIAHAIEKNHPEVILMVLLIDERPEEVTDMRRSVKGEVLASTFDEPPERHTQVADMVIEKARRLVEYGKDVVILLDSITRFARANNAVIPHSGKILSGGVDANAMQRPKRFFGAARKIENGGSLTIIGTALIDTGSKMDEVIFEEFKGTGNNEVVLDRRLSEKRIWPAIDIFKSGTRKEELLLSESALSRIRMYRNFLQDESKNSAYPSIDIINSLRKLMSLVDKNDDILSPDFISKTMSKIK